jgi:hypothetical protein
MSTPHVQSTPPDGSTATGVFADAAGSAHGGNRCSDADLKLTSDTESVCSVCKTRFRWNGETGAWNLEGNAPNGGTHPLRAGTSNLNTENL